MAQAVVRRVPYKDFLQPALHRRFSTAASVLFLLAYVESLALASWGSCTFHHEAGTALCVAF